MSYIRRLIAVVCITLIVTVARAGNDKLTTGVYRAYGQGGSELYAYVESSPQFGYDRSGWMIRLTSVDVNKALDQVVRGSLWLEGSVSGLGRFQKDAQDVARKIATLDQRCVARGVSEIDDWAEVGAVTGAFSVVRGSVATEIAGRLKDYTVESKAGPVVVVDFRMRDGLAEVRVRSTARWHEVTLPADAFYLFCRALDSGRIRAKVEANVKRVRAEAAAKKELLSI